MTVIVPAFNAEQFLADTLQSVQRQTLHGWRCVVVDDGSSDRTAEVAATFVERDPRFSLIRQPNRGPAAARNAGATGATSAFLLFLDADDLLLPVALATLVAALESHEGRASAAYCSGRRMDSHGNAIAGPDISEWARERFEAVLGAGTRPVTSALTPYPALVYQCRIMTPGMVLICRELFAAVGGFEEDRRIMVREDWDLWIRLSRTLPMLHVDRELVLYRRHNENMSRHDAVAGIASWRVRQRAARTRNASPEERSIAAHAARLHYFGLTRQRIEQAGRALSDRRWSDFLPQLARAIVDASLGITFLRPARLRRPAS